VGTHFLCTLTRNNSLWSLKIIMIVIKVAATLKVQVAAIDISDCD
jgi:hypothetical protein